MLPVFEETNHSWADVKDYYRDLRPHNITSDKYKHLLLLLYWPLYGMAFFVFELVLPLHFHPIYCPLDDRIPFQEIFVIPYYYWFAFMGLIIVYTCLFNVEAFKRCMYFIMATYTITLIIYFIYPSCQELRPEVFPRDNVLTRIVGFLYNFDSNENVCPSIHVLGSVAVGIAGLQCRRFSTPAWRMCMILSMILISLSTVFIKQHSVIDIAAALLLSAVVYPFTFGRKPKNAVADSVVACETVCK